MSWYIFFKTQLLYKTKLDNGEVCLKKIIIDKKIFNQRLDKFLFKFLNAAPKNFIYKMIRKKNILLNSSKATGSEVLKINDEIYLYLSDDTIQKFRKPKIKIKSKHKVKILFENEDILICDKPAGVLSQPNKKTTNDSLLNRLYNMYNEKTCICNRLDRNTSGIVLCAKNFIGAQNLNNLIKNHLVDKYYLTIVKGKITTSGTLENFTSKDKFKNKTKINPTQVGTKIITKYKPLISNDNFSLLEIKLITGKSHQIRLQLSNINHPIIGDQKYGDIKTNLFFKNKFGLNYQLLHAHKIEFQNNPFINQKIISEPPKIFLSIKKFLFGNNNQQKNILTCR